MLAQKLSRFIKYIPYFIYFRVLGPKKLRAKTTNINHIGERAHFSHNSQPCSHNIALVDDTPESSTKPHQGSRPIAPNVNQIAPIFT